MSCVKIENDQLKLKNVSLSCSLNLAFIDVERINTQFDEITSKYNALCVNNSKLTSDVVSINDQLKTNNVEMEAPGSVSNIAITNAPLLRILYFQRDSRNLKITKTKKG